MTRRAERKCLGVRYLLVPYVLLGICGCAAPRPDYTVKSVDPTEKIPAIKIAVRNKDLSVLPMLVKDLDSDDPAVRFYADDGLQKLTGENFGYLYYADEKSRQPAEEQWKSWLAGHYPPGATTHATP